MSQPSANRDNGDRGPGGRFAPGNKGGPGNPHAKRVARLRGLLLNAVSDEDLKAVVNKLVEQAKAGDMAAIRELLQRLLGPPVELDFTERLEALETMIRDIQKQRMA